VADENLNDLTKDELLEKARAVDLEGRSDMTKDELVEALSTEDGGDTADATSGDSLRHTPGSTAPKTGPVPAPFPTEPSVITERRWNGDRSAARVVRAEDRRAARRERLSA
jgi:hypothetical protein